MMPVERDDQNVYPKTIEYQSFAPVVHNFAFVMPGYDYEAVDKVAPSCDEDCVMWIAFGWDHKNNSWKKLGGFDTDLEARAAAADHHKMMRSIYRVEATDGELYPATTTVYDVEDEQDTLELISQA